MRKWVIGTALAFVVVAAATALSLTFAWRSLNSPMAVGEPQVFLEVPSGTSLSRLSADLAERGLLRHPVVLTWYGRMTGEATRIHAGEYTLAPGMTPI